MQKLPLKNLKEKAFSKELGKAHCILYQFDQMLRQKKFSTRFLDSLLKKELLATAQEERITVHDLKHPTKAKEQTVKKVLNYQSALLYGTKMIKKHNFSLTFFLRMHRLIKKGSSSSQDIGKFRKRQNWIGPQGCTQQEAYFLPPPYQKISAMMNNLKQYLNAKEKDPLVQLAVFFAQLLVIHPFMDGNGRLARSLIPLILFKKKVISKPLFYMSGYFKKHRQAYFEKLFLITGKQDWEGWIRFFLKGIIEEGRKILERVV